uniref:Uncharacterized protein n=1 Tax=Romanomermis culicivorax TaxID=13658 RepID=A0A915HKJ4_ROMCU
MHVVFPRGRHCDAILETIDYKIKTVGAVNNVKRLVHSNIGCAEQVTSVHTQVLDLGPNLELTLLNF